MTKDLRATQFNLKVPRPLVTALASALALSACQSTPIASSNLKVSNGSPQLAKNMMMEVIQKQRRSAYAYHSSLAVSNKPRQAVLAAANKQQLAMADESLNHCEHVHDQAYIELMEQAEKEDQDIQSEAYATDRQALKTAYLNCDAKLQQWEESHSDDEQYTDDDEYKYNDDAYAIEQAKSEIESIERDEAKSDEVAESTEATTTDDLIDIEDTKEETEEGSFLPNYDGDHTQLDVKKAKLIEAYLLKPLSLTAQGVYQPRAGIFTLLPTVQFKTRNHITAVNQPIYIDAKAGAIYLWADNFAYPLSENLDERLGSNWQNKWLKLSLNDGSLPKGFGRDLIKSHFKAIDDAYAATPASEYQFLDKKSLKQLTPELPAAQLPMMINASTIIRHQQSLKVYDDFVQRYGRSLYEQISQKYPELIEEEGSDESKITASWLEKVAIAIDAAEADDVNSEMATESELQPAIASAESLPTADDSGTNEQVAETSKDPMFSSKWLMTEFLSTLKKSLDKAEAEKPIEKMPQTDESKSSNQDSKVKTLTPISNIAYAQQKSTQSEHGPIFQEMYGLGNRGQVLWYHSHIQLSDENSRGVETAEGIAFDLLTQYSPLDSHSVAFPNLPKAAQQPTEQNSIDLKSYIEDLIKHYESGGGTEAGKEYFTMFRMARLMYQLRNPKVIDETSTEAIEDEVGPEVPLDSDTTIEENSADDLR